MLIAPVRAPKGTLGIVIFGTADGFDLRGLGGLKSVDAGLRSFLDMRGGFIDLRGFERDGGAAWFAMPTVVAGTPATLLGQVWPCRDATNRAGLAGAAVALQLTSDDTPVPNWRGRQAFGLTTQLLHRLVVGTGFDARINFETWKWPESLRDIARTPASPPAAKQYDGQVERLSIDADWAHVTDDPATLFIDYLRLAPPGGLAAGVFVEAVDQAERKQDRHLSSAQLANRADELLRDIEHRLIEEKKRADRLERLGQLQHAEITKLKASAVQDATTIEGLNAKVAALGTELANTTSLYKDAKTYADRAKQGQNALKAKHSERLKEVEERYKKKLQQAKRKKGRDEDEEAQLKAASSLARILRTLSRNPDGKRLLQLMFKQIPGALHDINEVQRYAQRDNVSEALAWLSELDREFVDHDHSYATTQQGSAAVDEVLFELESEANLRPEVETPASDDRAVKVQVDAPQNVRPQSPPSAPEPGADEASRIVIQQHSPAPPQPEPGQGSLAASEQRGASPQRESRRSGARQVSAAPRPQHAARTSARPTTTNPGGSKQSKPPQKTRGTPKSNEGDDSFSTLYWVVGILVLVMVVGTAAFLTLGGEGAQDPAAPPNQVESAETGAPVDASAQLDDGFSVAACSVDYDAACAAALQAVVNDLSSATNALALETLSLETANSVLAQFEDAAALYARAISALGDGVSASDHEAIYTLRQALLLAPPGGTSDSPAQQFFERVRDKRSALEDAGEDAEAYRGITVQLDNINNGLS